MNKASRKAIIRQRREIVDALVRQGFTPLAIARCLAADENCINLLPRIPEGLDEPARIREVYERFVKTDVGEVRKGFLRTVTATDAQEALAEYVAREDRIFAQCWRDHDMSSNVRDRILALQEARESARAKARALGVSLDRISTEEGPTVFNLMNIAVLASGQLSNVDSALQKLEDDPAIVEASYKLLPTVV